MNNTALRAEAQSARGHKESVPYENHPYDGTHMVWIVNTFLDNFFKVVLPVLYRGLIS